MGDCREDQVEIAKDKRATPVSAFGAEISDLVSLAEESPAMLWQGDVHGKCVYLNRAMRAFWGLRPEDCGVFDWATSLLPEDQAAVFGPFGAAMEAVRPFVCEGRYRRADGEVRVLRTRAHPYWNSAGGFAGMVGVNEDITDLRAADQELLARNKELDASLARLQSTADRFALATSISGLAMSEHDEHLRYIWAHNVPDSLGKTPTELVGAQVGGAVQRLLRQTLTTGKMQSEELSFLSGQQRLWVDIQTIPSTLPDGRPGVIASALDVTARKLNEAKLQLLARELGHRVKNVFAVVQAIIRQSTRTTPVPEAFIEAVEDRLAALSHAQDSLLSMSDDRFEMSALLTRQLSHLDRVKVSGPEVLLPGKLAPYLALAVHELGTNALKYGSLRGEGGIVYLTWKKPDPDNVQISWTERGGAVLAGTITNVADRRGGFGSQLLTRVFENATGGQSRLSFESEGLVWTATIPTAVQLTL